MSIIQIEKNLETGPKSKFFFIVSCGRSGTTLLRKLLMNSGTIHIPPESGDFLFQVSLLVMRMKQRPWDEVVKATIDLIRKSQDLTYWNLDLSGLANHLLKNKQDQQTLQHLIIGIYQYHQQVHNPASTLIGDKTPFLVLRLDWIKVLFPQAKIIHLVRDSRAVGSSRKKYLNETLQYAVKRWCWSVKEVNKHKNSLNILEVKYEDLVEQPEKILKSIANHLGVIYTSEFFKEKSLSLGDDVKPHHFRLNTPITTVELDRWKSELSKDEVAYINLKTHKFLKQYSYPLHA